MPALSDSSPAELFYGWVVVAATFVALFVVFGVAYSFAAFFSSFQQDFQASRGDVSLIFALCGFLYFTVGAFAGNLADRFGPRWVITTGMVFLAAGVFAASRADSLAALYATYSVGVGFGVGCVYVPSVGAVQPWFIRHRGLASGLAVSGIGVGTLVVPLIAVWMIAHSDWRTAFEMFAGGALLLGLASALIIDNSPARRGQFPDHARNAGGANGSGAPRQAAVGLTLREALRTRAFWLCYAGILLGSVGLFIPFVHLAPYAMDHGHAEATGVLLMGLIGVGSIIGRFGLAGFGDRIGRRDMLCALYAGMAVMLLLWLASSGVLALGVFAVVFGTCYGAFVALGPAIAMDLFGARNVAGIIGALYTAAGVGNLIGPTLAGFAYDMSGGYALPIICSAALMVGAAASAWRLRREPACAG